MFSLRDSFSEDELEYYSRQIVMKGIGLNGQSKLKKGRVLIAGLGGLGSPISTQLATMGVGFLRLVDRDVVEASNLQRQHLYSMNELGLPKAEAASIRLSKMNPYIEIDPVPAAISSDTLEPLLGDIDVIVDGLDNMKTRYILNRACVERGLTYVHGAVITNVGNATTIVPGETPCLECFQAGLDDESLPSCATAGVVPNIISIIASIQTSEVVNLLLGRKLNLAGRLIHCDLSDLSFDTIEIQRVANCPVCGDSGTHPSSLEYRLVEEVCGREGKRVYVISPKYLEKYEIHDLRINVLSNNFNIFAQGNLGLTFSEGKVKGSLMVTGNAIIEGVDSKEQATDLYFRLIEKGDVPK
jgi:adenylyltransferase/sulfurtransferase